MKVVSECTARKSTTSLAASVGIAWRTNMIAGIACDSSRGAPRRPAVGKGLRILASSASLHLDHHPVDVRADLLLAESSYSMVGLSFSDLELELGLARLCRKRDTLLARLRQGRDSSLHADSWHQIARLEEPIVQLETTRSAGSGSRRVTRRNGV